MKFTKECGHKKLLKVVKNQRWLLLKQSKVRFTTCLYTARQHSNSYLNMLLEIKLTVSYFTCINLSRPN